MEPAVTIAGALKNAKVQFVDEVERDLECVICTKCAMTLLAAPP